MARIKKPERTPDGQMELVEHLAELRTRIFRSIIYLITGMILTYNLFGSIYTLFFYPLSPILAEFGSTMLLSNIADAFLLRMQVCFIAGITVAFPFITMELWGFISPALTPEERKPIIFLAPFSVLLFVAGVVTAYASLPACYSWMAQYIKDIPGGALYQDPKAYILLTAKIMLAFGIGFELPVILLFLARIGVITSALMTTYWRHATVLISIAAAVLTPSNDPLTMLMMAVPMAGLYLLSIGLVRAFEPKEGREGPPIQSLLLVSLAPLVIITAGCAWLWHTHAFSGSLHIPPRPAQLEKTIENNQKEAQKTKKDLEAQMEEVLTRMKAIEDENALLKQQLEQMQGTVPAPTMPQPETPQPETTPQPEVTPPGVSGERPNPPADADTPRTPDARP